MEHLYTAFLYGVNIPGGVWVTRQSVTRALEALESAAFVAIVGRPDTLLLRGAASVGEDALRRAVTEALDCPCVVIAASGLKRIVESALRALETLGVPVTPPYRLMEEGAEWEWCMVLCSESLPPDAADPAWLFPPTPNARAVAVLARRALLARKRWFTPRGKRIMLGATLLEPWARVLERKGASVACLTSRTLNRVEQAVRVAAALGWVG